MTLLVNVIRRTRCLEGRLVGEKERTAIRENKQQPVVRNLGLRPARDFNLLCDFG